MYKNGLGAVHVGRAGRAPDKAASNGWLAGWHAQLADSSCLAEETIMADLEKSSQLTENCVNYKRPLLLRQKKTKPHSASIRNRLKT